MNSTLHILLFLALIFSFNISVSQEYVSNNEEEPLSSNPVFGLGSGVFAFYGDVNNSYNANPFISQSGKKLMISKNINSFLRFNFYYLQGTLTGNNYSETNSLNFKTNVSSGGINVSYNFSHVLNYRSNSTFVRPFVSLGLETLEFNSKADLKDKNGNLYHYWSDGTIRNLVETPSNYQNSLVIQRDYQYETDLRKENLEGANNYSKVAVSIPIGVGVDVPINDMISIQLGTTMHFSLSDYIDNVSDAGKDKYLFSYVSIHIDLFSSNTDDELPSYTASNAADYTIGDTDKDRVNDFKDDCPLTPAGVSVDEKGCPLDGDKDGVPNYRDNEKDTPDGVFVNKQGVTLSEEQLIKLANDTLAIAYSEISFYYPGMRSGFAVKSFETEWLEVPERFKRFDLDGDEYISLDELNNALDAYFEFGGEFSIHEIYELNDFFFDQ